MKRREKPSKRTGRAERRKAEEWRPAARRRKEQSTGKGRAAAPAKALPKSGSRSGETAYEETTGRGGVPIKTWTRGVPFEVEARRQLENVARLPFIHSHVAAMPDVHFGRGATVGSVIPTVGAVVPAAVGVDIGCGMVAQRTSLTADCLPDSLVAIRSEIEAAVPHGGGGGGRIGAWKETPTAVGRAWRDLSDRYRRIIDGYPSVHHDRAARQLGTLGGGNHFVEICLDQDDHVWVLLHSGSRGVGNRIGTHFIHLARREMQRHDIHLPDRDLAYLREGSELFDDYLEGVGWAQDYARINRDLMLAHVLEALRQHLPRFQLQESAINCHHNYVQQEHHFGREVYLTRKGAVSARDGELGIIPGSMGARSFIVRGKGNPDSFHSCSHGAGRRMSRTAARRRFSVADHKAATAGVECRKDKAVIDETPEAYKPIDAVMHAQRDLIDVVHELRQVICVKG